MAGIARIDIANMALGLLLRDTIRDPNGPEPAAVQTKLHMDMAIESVIAEYDWPYCRVVQDLQVVDGVNLRGWAYAYQIPSDAVMVWRISDARETVVSKYELGMTDDVTADDNFIYADDTPLTIRYGSRRVNLNRFPPFIIDLIAKNLAIRVCMILTKDKQLYDMHSKKYPTDLSSAKTIVANMEPELQDVEFTPEVIAVRSQ